MKKYTLEEFQKTLGRISERTDYKSFCFDLNLPENDETYARWIEFNQSINVLTVKYNAEQLGCLIEGTK